MRWRPWGAGDENQVRITSLEGPALWVEKWGFNRPSCHHNLVRRSCVNREEHYNDAMLTGGRHQAAIR